MSKIDILLQGEHLSDIVLVCLPEGATFELLLDEAAKHRRGCDDGGHFLIFLEDEDEPLEPRCAVIPHEPGRPHRVHVHRCRTVEVTFAFNGQIKSESFSPARTVGSVKRFAAEKLFGMNPKDAAEHVLQIAGTADRPEPDTHLGALVRGHCELSFDLVPLSRVEG